MPDSDLSRLMGMQEELRQYELEKKLNLFEEMFSGGHYTKSKRIADELYHATINGARGYAVICSRAHEHFNNILKEKGRLKAKRVARIFDEYHFDGWIYQWYMDKNPGQPIQINLKIRKGKIKYV